MLTCEFSIDELKYLLLYYLKIPEKSKENDSAIMVRMMMKKMPEQKDYILSIASKMIRLRLISGKSLTKLGRNIVNSYFNRYRQTSG